MQPEFEVIFTAKEWQAIFTRLRSTGATSEHLDLSDRIEEQLAQHDIELNDE